MKRDTLVRTSELEFWGDPQGGDLDEYLIGFTYAWKVGIEFVSDSGGFSPPYAIRLFGDASSVLTCLLEMWDNGEDIKTRRAWALRIMTQGTEEMSYETTEPVVWVSTGSPRR